MVEDKYVRWARTGGHRHKGGADRVETEAIKIAAAGDILIAKPLPQENSGCEEIAAYLNRAHVRLANLETTITDGSRFASAYSGGTWLTADEACLAEVGRYGFNVMGFANNHTMDYAYDGLADTLEHIKRSGMLACGAGKNLYEASRPVTVETPGGRVGIVDICSTFEDAARAGRQTERQTGRPGLNPLRVRTVYRVTREHARLLQEIARHTGINALREEHRKQGFIAPLKAGTMELGANVFEVVEKEADEGRYSYADERDVQRTLASIAEAKFTCQAVIVMVHSHEIKLDQEHEADYFLEDFARRCIDAGADAVVGSGTHQMKGVEIYGGKPIFYCLGNFMFENEFVRLLPADYMEKYGLDAHASAAEGIATRTRQAVSSLYSRKPVYQTALPYFEMQNGVCTHLEFMPVSLGFDQPQHLRGIPRAAQEDEGREIAEYLNRASAPYGTAFRYDAGRIVLK